MNDILLLINTYIDRCANCHPEDKYNCGWFHTLCESKGDDPDFTPDEYLDKTYEELACMNEKEAGRPYCGDQYTFDGLMMRVRELLKKSEVPTDSEQLLQLLTDIVQMEQRIDRLDSECEVAFTNPVMAVMEACLAHIDYFYLKAGLDIYSLIESVHGDYHRTRLLKNSYIGGVVNVLLQKAIKLTVEQVVEYPGNLLNLLPPVSFADLDKMKLEPQPAASEEEESVIESEESKSPLEVILKLLTAQPSCDFVAAVSMYLGVRPSNYHEPFAYYKKNGFIDKHLYPKQFYIFPQIKELIEELKQEIAERKNNERELNLYMSSILSPLQYIVPLLHPGGRGYDTAALEVAFGVSGLYKDYSIKRFAKVFHKAAQEVAGQVGVEDERYYEMLHDQLRDKYFDDKVAEEDFVLIGIYDMRNVLNILQCAIEAALLFNGVPHDYKYYQKLTGIHFVSGVTDVLLSIYTGMSTEFIKNMVKECGHSIFIATKDGETMDAFVSRLRSDKSSPILEEYDIQAERRKSVKPILQRGVRLADIPLSGVEEVDALENYFDQSEIYLEYYFGASEESFKKKCEEMAADKTLTRDEKEVWICKVLNTLDSAYAIADHDQPKVQGMAVSLFSTMEFAFMQVADPICIRKQCFLLDTTLILRQVFPHDKPKKPETNPYNLFDFPYELYNSILLETLGGNIVHFERRMCKNCPLVKCPYRNIHSKEGVYIPEEYPQDLLAPLDIEAESQNPAFEKLPEELKSDKAKKIWKMAQDAGLVDDDYEFHGSKRQLSLFANLFSQALFGENRWTVFTEWCGYQYFSKTLGEFQDLEPRDMSKPLQAVFYLFNPERKPKEDR